MSHLFRLVAAAVLVAVGLPSTQASAQDASLTVFAAASMKNALDDADVAFTKFDCLIHLFEKPTIRPSGLGNPKAFLATIC